MLDFITKFAIVLFMIVGAFIVGFVLGYDENDKHDN